MTFQYCGLLLKNHAPTPFIHPSMLGLWEPRKKLITWGWLLWSSNHWIHQNNVLVKAPQDGHSLRTHKPSIPWLSTSLTYNCWNLWKHGRGKWEENRMLCNMHQFNSLKSHLQVSRRRLKWQGGGCFDIYPGGALMMTDSLLCRGLIESDGLINESQVPQAKGKGSSCWA